MPSIPRCSTSRLPVVSVPMRSRPQIAVSPPRAQDAGSHLATLVRVLAKAEKGDHGQGLAAVKGLLRPMDATTSPSMGTRLLPSVKRISSALIRDGRYELASELCDCACDEDDAPAALKEHFEARMDRLKLLGKDAPQSPGSMSTAKRSRWPH